ncbi:MAG: MotA/TolQ/ExbB proton channel family protein [Thiohalospira sp.]
MMNLDAYLGRLRAALLPLLLALTPVAGAQEAEERSEAREESGAEREEAAQGEGEDGEKGERTLREAYQQEFAFLVAQRRELERRLADFRERAEEQSADAEADVEALQGRVDTLKDRAERLQKRATKAERSVDDSESAAETLKSTFQQADATLEPFGEDIFSEEDWEDRDKAGAIKELFSAGDAFLEQASSIRREEGSFFLADGSETEGEVLHLGRVATYSLDADHPGILLPAGEGQLKLASESHAETAEALAAGEVPESLPLFLYTSLDDEVSESTSDTILGTIEKGGTIAWLIVGLGALALLLVLGRIAILLRASSRAEHLVADIKPMVEMGRIQEAVQACRHRRDAVSRVMTAALQNIDRERAHLEDVISEAMLRETGHLDRFGGFILVIAAVSPLLGLLGTVTGMIATFEVITEFGTGDPKLLSGGISTALVTTELGLIVAIPTLLVGNLLSGWAGRIKDDMEQAALRVTNVHDDSERRTA